MLRSTAEHPELAFARVSTRKAATRERRSNIDLISSKLSLLSSSILLIPALSKRVEVFSLYMPSLIALAT